MIADRTEQLIREALDAEASRAPDPRAVLAGLAGGRARRRRAPLVVAAGVVVVAVVAAVVVPKLLERTDSSAPAAAASEQDVLLVGLDSIGYADSIVLTHLGKDGSVSAVSLPRDSWVNVPDLGMRKLNAVYAQARATAIEQGQDPAVAQETGARALVSTVRDLTGAGVEHYAMVDMADFAALSEAVGGVEVCLRAPTEDPRTQASFPAGKQTISGPIALAFLRQRIGLPNGDFDRIVRLQAFLRSLTAKLLADEDGLTAALETFERAAHVDPELDLLGLADQLRDVRPDDVRVATVPIENSDLRTPEGASAVGLNPERVRTFVEDIATTTPPEALPPGDVPCVN